MWTYITDLDQDGSKEILCRSDADQATRVYECTGDNDYHMVYKGYPDLPESLSYLGGIACGDYDGDGLMEMVMSEGDGIFPHVWSQVYIMENTAIGVDSYATIAKDSVLTLAAYNLCTGEDMDGNGKKEFVILGRHNPGDGLWDEVVTIFEATGNDTYVHVWEHTFQTGLGLLFGQCDIKTGDVDRDGRQELVIATPESLFVYKAVGIGDFQQITAMRTGADYANRVKDGVLLVHDMNRNGYDEVVLSGRCDAGGTVYETRFYEAMGEVVFDSVKATSRDTGITVEWWTGAQFANYGFELYKHEPGMADTAYYLLHLALDSVQCDTTHRHYFYHDSDVMTDSTYRYKVRALTLNNDSDYHGPVTALGVGGNPAHGKPLPFALCQNAPNPFRRSTAVRYQLPAPGLVELSIYNAAGQIVKTLVRGSRPAGGHCAVWDGRDDRGRPAASGIYFCRLSAGGSSDTRKMVVLQ
ncbi:MAG: FG-GAP-like repeat-containing protein [Candidatus Edwardsbacteria bacterium]|jgi:hypothetical protein|nr:FG-GAP-like repeat-containing protein [Candidatus Edwardsbacteria bacterium]